MSKPEGQMVNIERFKGDIVGATGEAVICLRDVARLCSDAVCQIEQAKADTALEPAIDGLRLGAVRAREMADRFDDSSRRLEEVSAVHLDALQDGLFSLVETMGVLNWDMHTLSFGFYLDVARLPRGSRATCDGAVAVFRELIRTLTTGQMALDGSLRTIITAIYEDAGRRERDEDGLYRKLMLDIAHHGELLGRYTQAECERAIASTMSDERHTLGGLSQQVGSATGRLRSFVDDACAAGTVNMDAFSAIAERFRAMGSDLRHLADRMGEAGDPIGYIAAEYGFFAEKVAELAGL